jgi:hypothetical protein
MEWITKNIEWILSGIGTTTLFFVISFFIKSKRKTKLVQKQKGGKKSLNIQSGRDTNL